LSPAGLNISEFGGDGRGFSLPTEAFEVEKKYVEVEQADGISFLHPLLEASTDAEAGAPLTVPEIAAIGDRGDCVFGGVTKTGDA
jgi:hypothetical protein